MSKLPMRHRCLGQDVELTPVAQQVGLCHRIIEGNPDASPDDDEASELGGVSIESFDLGTGNSRTIIRDYAEDDPEGSDAIPRRTGLHRPIDKLIR